MKIYNRMPRRIAPITDLFSLNVKTAVHVQFNQPSHQLTPDHAILIRPYQLHHFAQLESSNFERLFCAFELEPGGFLEPLGNSGY